MYVTDTHPFVYHLQQKYSKLGNRTRRLFRDAEEGQTLIYVPSVVLWEIGRPNGPLEPSERFDHWCRSLDSAPGYTIEPLDWQDVYEARNLPFRGPMDCLIAGTAIRLGMPLITKDVAITDSGLVQTVW